VRVLVLDDEAEMRETLQEVLRQVGHVTAGMSGEAFRTEMAQDCDLLITDLYMPGREGLEIIAELRRVDPYLKILAISGGTDKRLMLKTARSLGASKVLTKPFTPDEFLGAVKEVLS
jgi:DNA-binding response OmpR family regulator